MVHNPSKYSDPLHQSFWFCWTIVFFSKLYFKSLTYGMDQLLLFTHKVRMILCILICITLHAWFKCKFQTFMIPCSTNCFIISGKNEQDVFSTIHKYHIDVFHGLHWVWDHCRNFQTCHFCMVIEQSNVASCSSLYSMLHFTWFVENNLQD